MPQSADRTQEGDTVSLTPTCQLPARRSERTRKPHFPGSRFASWSAWTVRCWSVRKVPVDSPPVGQHRDGFAGSWIGNLERFACSGLDAPSARHQSGAAEKGRVLEAFRQATCNHGSIFRPKGEPALYRPAVRPIVWPLCFNASCCPESQVFPLGRCSDVDSNG